ncbi:MAG: helix-turn-helix transcriptional regulator [Peptostreptococcaceae bacterium]
MEKLKEIRESNKIKQGEMAKLLNISACNYFKKESGQIRFSLYEAKLISDYFNMQIEEIFFDKKVSKSET